MTEKYDLRKVLAEIQAVPGQYHETCLLYTSDAADEL